LAVKSDDAGSAAADHFDLDTIAQSEFFEPLYLLRPTHQLADLAGLASGKKMKRNQVSHGTGQTLAGGN
jgi:hypothetical protein